MAVLGDSPTRAAHNHVSLVSGMNAAAGQKVPGFKGSSNGGMKVLVTHDARSIAAMLSTHPFVTSVSIEGSQKSNLQNILTSIRPDVVVTSLPASGATSRLCASLGKTAPALVTFLNESDPCLPPPLNIADRNCDLITLPRDCGQVGEVLAQICQNNQSTPNTPRFERVLVVAKRGEIASRILRSLLGCSPAIAPLFVDSVDLAHRWLQAAEFDCVIVSGALDDGHAADCLELTNPAFRPPAIGISAAQDVNEFAALARAGCIDLMTPTELQSRKVFHQRVRDNIAVAKSRRAAADPINEHLMEVLAEEQEKLIADARSDRLTGVLNRSAFDDLLDDAHTRCQAGECGYSLLLLDIDNFKLINDRCGHQRGDEVLRIAAHTMSKTLDGRGFLARIGGEEFAAVCNDCTADEAAQIAEKLRASVQDASPNDIRLTISAGYVTAPRPGAPTPKHIIELADAALYRAKHAGRNRVIAA
ncbi:MAG: GGDEF domain-containing protein [Phycisphaerales bacterium]